MSCVGKLKEPYFTVLGLVALAFSHVLVDDIDKFCNQQTDELIFEAQEKMLEIGGVSFVKAQVEKLVAFAECSDSKARGSASLERTQKVLDNDKKLSEFF